MMGLPVRARASACTRSVAPARRWAACCSRSYTLSGYGLHGMGLELDAIAATVIGGALLSGGVGYVAGCVSGVLTLGAIQTLIAFDGTLSSWWTRIVIGVLLGLFCVMQRVLEWWHQRRAGPG
jgi:ribose/xylose/arabinose/galactoside ABC-type transport system permease subunit